MQRFDLERLFRISNALSDSARFQILDDIHRKGTLTSADVSSQPALSPASISHQVHELMNAEKDGRFKILLPRRSAECVLASTRKISSVFPVVANNLGAGWGHLTKRKVMSLRRAENQLSGWPAGLPHFRRAGRIRTQLDPRKNGRRPESGSRPAKLSAKEIKTIRALLKTADIPVAEIAARFGIARSTLYRAIIKPAA
jgi:hypothetical protein